MEDSFSKDRQGVGERRFQDDSNAVHLLCTLFLFLLRQLHLRSSGIRSLSHRKASYCVELLQGSNKMMDTEEL